LIFLFFVFSGLLVGLLVGILWFSPSIDNVPLPGVHGLYGGAQTASARLRYFHCMKIRQKRAPAILTAFFVRRDDAYRAYRDLKRKGFRRTALIHRNSAGRITTRAPLLWFAFRRRVLVDHSRRLGTGESVLILHAPIALLRRPIKLLRAYGETPPVIFVLNRKRAHLTQEHDSLESPLAVAQIHDRARHLAEGGTVTGRPRGRTTLLDRLKSAGKWLVPVCSELAGAAALGQRTSPVVEWILDNEYIVESNIREVQQNLSRRFYRELPALSDGPHRGMPRVYDLAGQLVADTALRLDRESIVSFIEAYQSVTILTTAELWAIPQMLRIALIESILTLAAGGLTELRDREIADFWAYRLVAASRRDPNHLFAMMAELTQYQPEPSRHFSFQLVDHLYGEQEPAVLVTSWLERVFQQPIEEVNDREQDRQAKEQVAVGNAFTSLRELAQLDWREIFEEVSRVERLLRGDPAGVYPTMDFATRDTYRREIEKVARRSGRREDQVARDVVDLASGTASGTAETEGAHVGRYLVGDRRAELLELTGSERPTAERLRDWASAYHAGTYLSGIGAFSALFLTAIWLAGLRELSPLLAFTFVAVALIPASQLAVEVVNYLVMRLFPARPLVKMDYEETGIPDAFRTLVVVPMMLSDARTIDEQVEKLEIRYLANHGDNLLFSLFSDFRDADHLHEEDDGPLLERAVAGLEELNRRYAGDRFLLLHRQRVWCESERKYIGWERKRGKLEELNRLIDGSRKDDAGDIVRVGEADRLQDVRFVITLDSDTQLPAGTARRMIETLAHPLNQPRFDATGRVAAGTYTIIQPRVSSSLPSSTGSPFSRLYTYAVGIDPYTRVISDVYQDLTGEGSYHGKGIYDVRAFSRVLSGRFPEQRLLSHDLIEGAFVRVGLASDIELLDEFPQDYLTFTTRRHRWIRGDWQIADWLLPRVPEAAQEGESGGRVRNPLSRFNRWKIFDNLRRSLIPLASVVLLGVAWVGTSHRIAWIVTLLVAAQLLFNTLAQPFTMATTRYGYRSFSLSRLGQDLLRTLADASLIPHHALVTVDAVLRVVYRRLISRRNLLEWTVTRSGRGSLIASLGLTALGSVLVGTALLLGAPDRLVGAAPWLALWFLSPLTGWLLSRRPSAAAANRTVTLPKKDNRYLRGIARRTWRYYADFVTAGTAWLPPDNYQVSHQDQVAMRTSPTNIGLWMLSARSARDFGYLTTDEVITLLGETMNTISRLERFQGHLLNWYDLTTLTPLEPRYVSTVDSGNLLGALWSLEHGLESLITGPLIDGSTFAGLGDTAEILRETVKNSGPALDDLIDSCHDAASDRADAPGGLTATLERLGHAGRLADLLVPPSGEDTAGEATYWMQQIKSHLAAAFALCDRYLKWEEILREKSDDELAPLGEEAIAAIHHDLRHTPSLARLAAGRVAGIRMLKARRTLPEIESSTLAPWIDSVVDAFSTSRWLAGEQLDRARRLIDAVRELSRSIDMRFLYDPRRKLFPIGFNVNDQRRDNAFYDLLASEARIGSFVAIARGDVPMEHWFTMGRPYNAIGRRRVLLSWTGTMFEYLMPSLLVRSYGNALLDKTAAEAVAVQIAYGQARRVPWGISESAYSDLDANKTYQYKAFGVPKLGLKRGLEEELVVAPYATLLALEIVPVKAVKNLRRLDSLGLLNSYGFYDAIDFSRQVTRSGVPGVLVRTYMSHHQGMGFLALNNYLHAGAVRNHFHHDRRVSAFEPLLHESVPALSSRYLATRGRTPVVDRPGEISPSVSSFDSPHTATPKTQLLGNGRYSLMVTNSGGGYSRWDDFEITRWRADATGDSGGIACYIHDIDADRLWSNGYYPTGGPVDTYSAVFSIDRAVIRRQDNGIEVVTEIVVSPEDNVEVRRITVANRSLRARRLNLTSYIELSLAPHRADLQHPAFNKLFIQTEALEDGRTLIAYRRPRREDEAPIFVAHRITHDAGPGSEHDGEDDGIPFDTDRASFIGRGRTLRNPRGAREPLGGTQGFVLDPIFSLRETVALAPGERRQLTLTLAAAPSREGVLNLMNPYEDPRAIDRAMDYAWAAAQIELRSLRIQPDEARRFQQIASHLIFPSRRLRPAAAILENRKGQSGLWPYGISGDSPIMLLTIADTRDIPLVRQTLRAHAYWRAHGFASDLVILNEEAGGYEHPLRDQLDALVRANPAAFLLNADQLPREDQTLLMAVSGVVLVAARGTLPQQLGLVAEGPPPPAITVRKRSGSDPSAELPFMELHYFNGVGGFTEGGREYAIYLGAGETNTPAPWVNVMANPDFGTLVGETGAGFTWYGNSQRNRLTAWSNDPVIDPVTEALYIRDEESGAFWTPTASPVRESSAYRVRHGAGYSVFEHNSHGIEQELTVCVPMDDDGGQPVKLQRLRLKNDTSRTRTLSVTHYLEWTLGENRESSQMHVTTSWDETTGALFARQRYHPEYGDRIAFTALTPGADSYTADRTMFLGRNGSLSHPAAMDRTELSARSGAGLDPCSALQTGLEILPGATVEVISLVGQTATPEQARELILACRGASAGDASLAFAEALEHTISWWDALLGEVEVHTPEESVNFLVNRWLLYQSLSCRMWARSATYQSGGAFGFRDQLQDAAAFVHSRPEITREQILLAASRQFPEGDVQHWWHPPGGAGIRSRISDDLLWLPDAVARYVGVTGDREILDEAVPFLQAPLLEATEHEVFLIPEVAPQGASLFEHCRRALEKGLTSGPNGLPLMGTGDWNDGMNLVGADGRGESVWLAWFLIHVLEGMIELARLRGDSALAQQWTRQRRDLTSRVESVAWDGEWYLRGFFDDGTPLGSSANTEARIDSLPQSWARISGAGGEERTCRAIDSAWNRLVDQDAGLVLLFEPPFDKSLPSPGYIKGYPPGVRENGGQYTHAALWFAISLARSGEGEKAVAMLRMLNPIEHARDTEAVWRYAVEPYVIAADVYRLPGRAGRGGWSWYTGSAAWMYRAWVEEILGLKIRGEEMRLDPVIPRDWDGFEMRYRHGEAIYEIRVENPHRCQRGVSSIEVDGRRLPEDGVIHLEREATKHRVLVRMGTI
jgi:cyclic beta-1,2-glucan synthetase